MLYHRFAVTLSVKAEILQVKLLLKCFVGKEKKNLERSLNGKFTSNFQCFIDI